MRSSSVAGDPHSERLQCSLSPLSLLGMLKDLYAKYDAALGANPTVSTRVDSLACKTIPGQLSGCVVCQGDWGTAAWCQKAAVAAGLMLPGPN